MPSESESRPLARPSVLSELVDHQPDSVVSRILAKHEGGSWTLFAFDAGQDISEHTVPYDALVQILEGTAEITVDGNAHTVEAGRALLMPADRPHAVRAPERFKMLLTMLRA